MSYISVLAYVCAMHYTNSWATEGQHKTDKEFWAKLLKAHFLTAQTSSPTNFVLLASYFGTVKL